MLWLSRRPEWQRSREFETTTRTSTPGLSRTADNSFGDDDDEGEDEDELSPGKVKTRVVFQPTFDTTHTIYYRGHWLRIKRSRKSDWSHTEVLSIRYLFHAYLVPPLLTPSPIAVSSRATTPFSNN
jgi:mitochondrial chaperone BCS1